MTDDKVKNVCMPYRGAATCKYLCANKNGWVCGKVSLSIKAQIDERTNMAAKGDNCEGDIKTPPNFIPAKLKLY